MCQVTLIVQSQLDIIALFGYHSRMSKTKVRKFSMDEMCKVEESGTKAFVEYSEHVLGDKFIDVMDEQKYRDKDIDFISLDGRIGYEVKADRHSTRNICLEIESNMGLETRGWLLYSEADYLFYYYIEAKTAYIFRMPDLLRAYKQGDFKKDIYREIISETPCGKDGKSSYRTRSIIVNLERLRMLASNKKCTYTDNRIMVYTSHHKYHVKSFKKVSNA